MGGRPPAHGRPHHLATGQKDEDFRKVQPALAGVPCVSWCTPLTSCSVSKIAVRAREAIKLVLVVNRGPK
eukprot:CAMPEP_0177659314 /NCGR_PEP_ID=MMETSP0447-20121125/17375_1 /TAXON_ID=0 /ORGANISM="Stygamoeba regulata, Strain BSH-02190019" /LENGTH=69 /DNA_ID=CAMNT_0019164173 /DNA_START=97 /DNA_END=304 /DNA_ORIENTATION=+